MSRVSVYVRDAVVSDASYLCALWGDLLPAPGVEGGGTGSLALAVSAVERTELDDTSRIVVAELDGDVVGCAFLRSGQASPLQPEHVIQVSHLQVGGAHNRSGVSSALMEAALTWAESRGVTNVVASTAASDRDANRFLARLGMTQVGVLRGASVAALRAKLPHDPSAIARHPLRAGRSVGQVVAARRSQRQARSREVVL